MKYILAKRIGVVFRIVARIFIRCHFIDRGVVLVFSQTVELGTSVAQRRKEKKETQDVGDKPLSHISPLFKTKSALAMP